MGQRLRSNRLRCPVATKIGCFETRSDRRADPGAGTVPGLFYATGHTRNGILLAPITAALFRLALLLAAGQPALRRRQSAAGEARSPRRRSEEHTSELQS